MIEFSVSALNPRFLRRFEVIGKAASLEAAVRLFEVISHSLAQTSRLGLRKIDDGAARESALTYPAAKLMTRTRRGT
ncbi:MAG TPA: hypothetical protein VGG45_18100 [Terracidiphilus sp.]